MGKGGAADEAVDAVRSNDHVGALTDLGDALSGFVCGDGCVPPDHAFRQGADQGVEQCRPGHQVKPSPSCDLEQSGAVGPEQDTSRSVLGPGPDFLPQAEPVEGGHGGRPHPQGPTNVGRSGQAFTYFHLPSAAHKASGYREAGYAATHHHNLSVHAHQAKGRCAAERTRSRSVQGASLPEASRGP